MFRHFTFIVLIVSAWSFYPAEVVHAGRKVAFLVGVNSYMKKEFRDLSYAEKDVSEVSKELKKQGFEVTLLLGKEATKSRMDSTIEELIKPLGKEDLVLVMLTGHGLQKTEGDAFFCPYDAFSSDNSTLFSLSTLLNQKLSPTVGRTLLLIDACRNNPDPSRGRSAGIQGKRISLPEDTAVIFSCKAGQKSFENEELKHGVFTYCLLEALRGKISREEIGWSDLESYVKRRMASKEFQKYIPEYYKQTPIDAGGVEYTLIARVSVGNNLPSPEPEIGNLFGLKKMEARGWSQKFDETIKEEFREQLNKFTNEIYLNPDDKAAYVDRGNVYLDLKKYDLAIQDYSQAIKIDPEYDVAYRNRGLTHKKKGEYDEAIKDCNKAISLNPKYVNAYVDLGNSHKMKGEYYKAVEFLSVAINLDPDYALAYNNRGNAYLSLKAYDTAIKDYTLAIQYDPEYALAYRNRGLAWQKKGENKKTIEDCTKAIKYDPDYADAYLDRGLSYYYMEDYDNAIKDYNQALKINPNSSLGYGNRGLAWKKKEEYSIALEDFNKAIRLNPEYYIAYNNRGNTYLILKDYDRAIKDYDQALKINPSYQTAKDNRALALRKKKSAK